MGNYRFTTEDFILYILNYVEPGKSTFMTVNKLAFLLEFFYLYNTEGKELSDAKYAAINHGAVIDNYKDVFAGMEQKGLVQITDHHLRVLADAPRIPSDVKEKIDPVLRRFSQYDSSALRALTHKMDSYLITSKNERVMGKVIKKDLASLETFFEELNDSETSSVQEGEMVDLPLTIDREKLLRYETR